MNKVFDSNILIYHLNNSLTPAAEEMIKQASEENAVVSVITRIEVLGWPDHTEEALQRAKTLLNLFQEYPLTEPIIDQCITLRQQRTLKIPDAIIAATALYLDFPLVTRNTTDFKGIEGLDLIDPFLLEIAEEDPETGDPSESQESQEPHEVEDPPESQE